MKEQKLKQEVCSIQQEAPSARQALLDNFTNLLKVAEYCHTNYLQSGVSSKKALEETKSFTSQSLASVVYQISTLANSLLGLLDAQTNLIGHMESSINLIGQTVEMHREKVARREIGISTVMKRVPRGAEMTPADPAVHRPTEYHRRPIDYSVLDSVGHQYTIPGKQHSGMIRKAGSSIRSFKAPGPVICPLPPSLGFGKPEEPPTESDVMMSKAPPTNNNVTGIPVSLRTPWSNYPVELVAQPTSKEFLSNHSLRPLSTPPSLEPVEEVTVLLPTPATPKLDVISNSAIEEPSPPFLPHPDLIQDGEVSSTTRRNRIRRLPPISRSLSLRGRARPHDTHLLPSVQSLMIPPPPPYAPPPAPLPLSSAPLPISSALLPLSARLRLNARLQHLDLELPVPPPPPLLDDSMQLK
ncbi:abl interactor 1 isoform X1 [Gadus morhua]|uniref:Abl interactor 1-like n=1 Tax=Gadus morhua TaxID=8049 RepID=A0A8C5BBL2_GADMO|nr:abl interactor 1-like isoform X1 [Gadus morhua]